MLCADLAAYRTSVSDFGWHNRRTVLAACRRAVPDIDVASPIRRPSSSIASLSTGHSVAGA
eukprot:3457623-Rhodomonas_salina.3